MVPFLGIWEFGMTLPSKSQKIPHKYLTIRIQPSNITIFIKLSRERKNTIRQVNPYLTPIRIVFIS